ncbi:MAG: hypothetical protein KF889_18000 [Alphaproteobacteria bacterium]|nr:hypothetical protein [Alphaproteobacteria bacterium]MCW5741347.1 hypothetical protein [Alphaproteobacteria bacterium]
MATFIALNRFWLGEVPGQAQAVAGDPCGWVAAQIDALAPARTRARKSLSRIGLPRASCRAVASPGFIDGNMDRAPTEETIFPELSK